FTWSPSQRHAQLLRAHRRIQSPGGLSVHDGQRLAEGGRYGGLDGGKAYEVALAFAGPVGRL
ncbi:MAG: hypothetical protein KC502_21315, partial [Myxococcales bacterium]|nr:hypothetical protein [Myxococcales bacterium]